MRLIRAFFMCMGMFTALPLPWRPWDERDRGLMIACLPLAGAVVGALWCLLGGLARAVLPVHLAAAVIAALPFLLTGMIHLDGFMDASDALLSWRPLEKRLEILKDAHCGSFAAAALALLMLGMYAASTDLIAYDLRGLVLIPIVTRCASAFCVSALKPLPGSQYAAQDRSPAGALAALGMFAAALIASGIWLGLTGLGSALAAAAGYALAMAWAYRTLGGVSGDLAGYALCTGELCGLAALAALQGGLAA